MVHSAEQSAGKFKHVECLIAGQPTSLIVDLGAKVSILSKHFYVKQLRHVTKLSPADLKLRSYTGQTIPCIGCVIVPVQVSGLPEVTFKFYVTEYGESMLGVDLFDRLGGSINLGSVFQVQAQGTVNEIQSVKSSSSVSLAQYPLLCKSTGVLKGFVHKPQVDPSVTPSHQKFWHPPLAMREPIAKELERMLDANVIERIDTSPWMSNVVTVRKKDGSVRLCVNLTSVNKALVPERFPLPTMEEQTERLAGMTVFSKLDLLWGILAVAVSS
jgi:hypothetical protein